MNRFRTTRSVALAAILCTVSAVAVAQSPDPFVAWARQHAERIGTSEPGHGVADLAKVESIVVGARVVAIGESIHGIREFLGLRHRLVELLVERMGFTAVAIESGLPESKIVYDYVLGADADSSLWDRGFTWTMGSFGEMRDLVEWMRLYNRDPTHTKKIHFYGVDVAGGNGSWVPAARQVLGYLDRVEPDYASEARARLIPLLEKFAKLGFTETNDAFAALSQEDRNAIAATVRELTDRLELLRVPYLRAASKEDYDWAHRIAVDLGYSVAMVTNYEARNRSTPVWNARDLAMAENVRWIREREGPGSGVIVLAHNAHIQTAKSVAVPAHQTSLGMFLRSLIGTDYRTIGFVYNRGAMWGGGTERIALPPADSGTIDGAMARVGLPMFLLDLRSVPKQGPVRQWLDRPIVQRIQNVSTAYNQLESWDGLIFVDSITPSRRP